MDIYHVCKYCKYYSKGVCEAGIFTPVLTDDVHQVAEDGGLSQVIEETLNEDTAQDILNEVEELLTSYKMSLKRKKEVKQLIIDMLPQHYDFVLKEKLDENISRLYQDRLDNATITGEVKILDPDNFYCSNWG